MDMMLDDEKLGLLRKVYSAQILATAQVRSRRLEKAFAAVPREKFMPAGRWTLAGPRGAIPLPDNNPALLYQDALFALKPSKGINNGEPSLHARMLSHLNVQPGDRVVHVGAGSGYYSAVLAELAGPQGRVTAIEFDAELAEMAAANLKDRSNVGVVHDDGARHPQAEAERIYVNFAVERPAQRWIDGLSAHGRLVFPLAAPAASASPEGPRFSEAGAAFRIERTPAGFAARWISRVFFVCAEGELAMDAPGQAALRAAFAKGGARSVKSLVWRRQADPQRCWFWSPEWALSYDAVGGSAETQAPDDPSSPQA
jgi:protein-L-isoaspartate(D-aspartate) O-methyltransferase